MSIDTLHEVGGLMKERDVPLIVYHANCPDGFGAAWCFWRRYQNRAQYIPAQYGDNPPKVAGRDVYLVDFSYERAVVEMMLQDAGSVTLIDHHKSAMESLCDLVPRGLRWHCNLHRSGAVLAWQYLFPYDACPKLLRHIEDRDLWRFSLDDTLEIVAYAAAFDYRFETWDDLVDLAQKKPEVMVAGGGAIVRKQQKDIEELLPQVKREMVIAGRKVPVANLPYTMASEAANMLAAGQPFAACYYDTPTARVFSLRSSPDGADVSLIARAYGGGGHVHAAGFRVPRTHELASS